jgi:hypothetical protein
LRVALAGDLVPFPEGEIIRCQFQIAVTASGSTTIEFVSAELADAAERDFSATGRSGVITISGPAPPQIVLGSVDVAPGQEVTVPIRFIANQRQIVTIAPLEFHFDPAALSFRRCLRSVGVSRGKQVTASVVESGRVRVVLAGDLEPLPEGSVIECTFAANPAASGTATLFFDRADLADDAFNDFSASGTDGSVRFVPGLPGITLQDASESAGEATVSIVLAPGGRNVVTLAPLVIRYEDGTLLSFVECTKDAAVSSGATLTVSTPQPGELRLVLAGDLEPFPTGPIAHCRFSTSAPAQGTATLTVIRASVADDSFVDYEASGVSGQVVFE